MKTLIIYDSFFGNTQQVAETMTQTIVTVLGNQSAVSARSVGEVKPEDLTGLDLLIVGSPTHAFRPTPAITKLIKSIPDQGLKGVKVAAFDTRIAVKDAGSRFLTVMVKLFGYAATPIANQLRRKAGDLVLSPAGFIVQGKEGPLKEGELARAADWARQMIAAIPAMAEPVAV